MQANPLGLVDGADRAPWGSAMIPEQHGAAGRPGRG